MDGLKNEAWSDRMRVFAPIILRLGLSLVFLWFGSEQIISANMWTGLIPDWAISISGMSPNALVHLNGAFEIILGAFLLIGYFTRVAALLLAFHLFSIIFIVGYTSIGVRDFGLSMAAISIFLYGIDSWSLDRFFIKKGYTIQ